MSICGGNRGVSGYAGPARVCADNAAPEQWEEFFHEEGLVWSQLVDAAPNRSIIRGVAEPVTRPSTAMAGSSAQQPVSMAGGAVSEYPPWSTGRKPQSSKVGKHSRNARNNKLTAEIGARHSSPRSGVAATHDPAWG